MGESEFESVNKSISAIYDLGFHLIESLDVII